MIFTSKLKRTKETAQLFIENGFHVKHMDILNEINGGICENMTYDEVKEKFGEKIANIVQECSKDENKNFKITMKESLLVKFADGLHNLGNNNDDWFIEKVLHRWQPHPTKPEHMNNPKF